MGGQKSPLRRLSADVDLSNLNDDLASLHDNLDLLTHNPSNPWPYMECTRIVPRILRRLKLMQPNDDLLPVSSLERLLVNSDQAIVIPILARVADFVAHAWIYFRVSRPQLAELDDADRAVEVNLFRRLRDESFHKLAEVQALLCAQSPVLTPNQETVLQELAQNSLRLLHNTDIAAGTKLDRRTVGEAVNRLIELELAQRESPRSGVAATPAGERWFQPLKVKVPH